MRQTPGQDAAIERLHEVAASARRALLTGPEEVDGDSIGASLALATVLRRAHPGLEVVVASPSPIPDRYRFLDGAADVALSDQLRGTFELALVLDGSRHRLGALTPIYDGAATQGLVDHHRSSDPAAYDLALYDPDRASTCDLVHAVARHPRFDVAIDRDTAAQLYTGIAYDTGVFRYSCTTPATLRLAAELLETGIDAQQIVERVFLDSPYHDTVFRGRAMASIERVCGGRVAHASVPLSLREQTHAGPGATEGLINELVFIAGVEVALLLVERPDGTVKISLRSRGRVDVAGVARALSPGGGGHDRAAGATLDGPLDGALARALAQIEPLLD